ncbi:hypothetical protein [Sphaerisporangium sp. NPDC051011]|uniref:hypothetical protein n=1 Tax=Sphaerisporangium sp. NPDC051011 TaxID=3155792 RepID=UPI003402DF38
MTIHRQSRYDTIQTHLPTTREDMTTQRPTDRLAELASEYFRRQCAADPFWATMFGIPGHDAEVPDPSRAADQRRLEVLDGLLKELDGLDAAGFGDQDRVTYAGADHDREPVRYKGMHTGLAVDLGSFSRKRERNAGSSGTVMG